MIIVEGILVLYMEELREQCNMKIYVDTGGARDLARRGNSRDASSGTPASDGWQPVLCRRQTLKQALWLAVHPSSSCILGVPLAVQ